MGAVSASRLAELYPLSDLFVLPSRYAGFGMAYADAIAPGLPVIGTTAGAIPETVPETAGVLVPPRPDAVLHVSHDASLAWRGPFADRMRRCSAAEPQDYPSPLRTPR